MRHQAEIKMGRNEKEVTRLSNIIVRRVMVHYPRHVTYEETLAATVSAGLAALRDYDPARAKLITYLWRRLLGAAHKSALMQCKQISGRWARKPPRCIPIDDIDPDTLIDTTYDIYAELAERGL
jgi:hypothetical protein